MQPPSLMVFLVGKTHFPLVQFSIPSSYFWLLFICADVFLSDNCVETDRRPLHCQCTFMGPKILDNHKCINNFLCAPNYIYLPTFAIWFCPVCCCSRQTIGYRLGGWGKSQKAGISLHDPFFRSFFLSGLDTNKFVSNAQSLRFGANFHIFFMGDGPLLLRNWYEIIALYNIKSVLTDFSASRQDKKIVKKNTIIRIKFLAW